MSIPTSGRHTPIWFKEAAPKKLGPLEEHAAADVAIVGAGIAGLTTAYLLAEQGLSVIVLDDGPMGSGETGRTSAHLASAIDDRFYELEKIFGEAGARLAYQSHAAAIDRIKSICQTEKIDCGFRRVDAYLFAGAEQSLEELEKEYDASRKAGLTVDWSIGIPGVPGVSTRTLRFCHQAAFHPMKYLQGLAVAAQKRGVRIYTDTHVSSVEDGAPAKLTTRQDRRVEARAIVVATNTPVNDRVVMHTKQMPYRTYIVGLDLSGSTIPDALYWDTGDPYHYVRITEDGTLIVGGEDHKTGQATDFAERYDRLEEWARQTFGVKGKRLLQWSGQVMEPVDYLGFLGRNPGNSNVYIITGDSGNGLTHATIGGMIITDLIQKRENLWTQLYDPSRKPLHSLGSYIKENLDVVPGYVEWVTPDPAHGEVHLQPDSGAVIQSGASKIAVYKDAKGQDHRFSAVCPHLGCVVHWNDDEKTWDCPCHGSRFACTGQVVNGPSNGDLKPIEEKA